MAEAWIPGFCTLPAGRHARLAAMASPFLLPHHLVASEHPPSKGGLPTPGPGAAWGVGRSVNSGQWNARNQGRKRGRESRRGDKMWRAEELLRKAQPCGWG